MQNKNTTIIIILLVIIAGILGFIALNKPKTEIIEVPIETSPVTQTPPVDIAPLQADPTPNTYTYKKHGFTIELPNGYVPEEIESEGGPAITIVLPENTFLQYVSDASFWERANVPSFTYIRDQKIGNTTFKVYTYSGMTFYWFKQGNVGYQFNGDTKYLETFKFVGWNQ